MADEDNNTEAKGGKDPAESLLNAVMGELQGAKRKKAATALKSLLETQEKHKTALAQVDAEITKFLEDFRKGIVPA